MSETRIEAEAVVIQNTPDDTFEHRRQRVGLLDALTDEPLDVEGYILRRLEDLSAWKAIKPSEAYEQENPHSGQSQRIHWIEHAEYLLGRILARYRAEKRDGAEP